MRELARAEGHAEGLAQGREDGLAEARSAASALRQALTEALALREQLAEETESDAVALALALAAKILAGTLAVEPERVLDTVRGALRRVTDRRRVTVLVDPADLETVSAAIAEVEAQVGGIDHCDVQADRRVGRGGAIVRTLESEVDASVDTQLERAREVIQAELGGGAETPPHEHVSLLRPLPPRALAGADLARCHGRVNNLIGLIIEATGLQAEVGEVCLVGPTVTARRCPPRSSASARAAPC